ncbi:MAG TPA: hypothetical protein VEL71_04975 [Candidatus Dormibacteraeota bacterium]|nr:hypothetical protein [Candidatus Dormibacteraeota bacterium]
MASQVELNSKVFRGLRAQFSSDRAEAVLTQAESMFQQSHFQSGLRDGNKAETYELFEGGWIDRALEFLGFGHWVIGRPGKNLTVQSRPRASRSMHLHEPSLKRSVLALSQPNPEPSLASILDKLIPEPLPRSQGMGDNAIHHLNIVAFGKPNTGKTSIGSSIFEYLVAKYGSGSVYAVRSSRDLVALLDNLPTRPYKAVLLFLDDMTKALENVDRKTRGLLLGALYDIRGALSRCAGMNEGLVIVLSAVHRFYLTPIDLRADADLLLVRSTGTPGTFDARTVRSMLGNSVYSQLREKEERALVNRSELGWTGWASRNGSGMMFVPRLKGPSLVPTVQLRIPTNHARTILQNRLVAAVYAVLLVTVLFMLLIGII